MKTRLAIVLAFCFGGAAIPSLAQPQLPARPAPPDLVVKSIRHEVKAGSIDVFVSNIGGKIAPPCQLHLKVYQNGAVTKEVIQNAPSIEKGGGLHVINFSTAGWAAVANAATAFEATINSDKAVGETNWANNTLFKKADEKGKKDDAPFGAGLPDYSVAGITVVSEQTALKVKLVNKGKSDSWGGELIVYALPKYFKKTKWALGAESQTEVVSVSGGNAEGYLDMAWVTAKQKFKPLAGGAADDLLVMLPTKPTGAVDKSVVGSMGVSGTIITTSLLTFEESVYYIVIKFPVGPGEVEETLGDNSYFFTPPPVESKVK